MPPHVRSADRTDVDAIGATMAHAFADDPVLSRVLPPGCRDRHRRLERFFAVPVRAALGVGEVLVADDVASAAVWRPPGRWRLRPAELVRHGPASLRALRLRSLVGMRVLGALEAVHPEEPHWYLEFLGTDPARQARGLGSAVLAPVLRRCDDELVPAYLESSKAANVPFYERLGFRVVREVELPGGPTEWCMWRDPRP